MELALSEDRRRPFRYLRQSRNRNQLDGDFLSPKFGIDVLIRPHAEFAPEDPNPNLEIGTNSIAVFLHANTRSDLRIRLCLGQRPLQILARQIIEGEIAERFSDIKFEFSMNRPQIYIPIIVDVVNLSVGRSLFRGI